jgi:hypothetical protein
VRFTPISLDEFAAGAGAAGEPAEAVALLRYLFGEVLDGRNVATADGVRQALGREATDFREFARRAAAAGAWA